MLRIGSMKGPISTSGAKRGDGSAEQGVLVRQEKAGSLCKVNSYEVAHLTNL